MQQYRIEVEHEVQGAFNRSLQEELAWAIGRQLTRGIVGVTVKLIRFEIEQLAWELRQEYLDAPPRWIPTSLRSKSIAEWSTEEMFCVCIGNAAIRARGSLFNALEANEHLVRAIEGGDSTFSCFRLALPQEAPTERRSVVMRNG